MHSTVARLSNFGGESSNRSGDNFSRGGGGQTKFAAKNDMVPISLPSLLLAESFYLVFYRLHIKPLNHASRPGPVEILNETNLNETNKNLFEVIIS